MYYYRVPAATDEHGSLRPAIPRGVSWVGRPRQQRDEYLILAAEPIPGLEPLDGPALDAAAQDHGIAPDILSRWAIRVRPMMPR